MKRIAAVVTAILMAVPAALGQDATVTEADRTDVAVTVYNNNLALVRDRRQADLGTGERRLSFADVAQQIRPETVSLVSLSNSGGVAVLEQNYEFDLISPDKLMEKYVGDTVLLQNFHKDIEAGSQEAKLLSVNGGPVYQVGEQIYLGYPGNVVLPRIPENLVARPSLVWTLDSAVAAQEIEVTYLTGGFSWQADYVLTVNADHTSMDLAGWVTLVNHSGATYEDAQLKLVAGAVNQVPAMVAGRGGLGGAAEDMFFDRAKAMVQEESFAEYHLYNLPRRTTIKENQSKQVSLLTAEEVAIEKVYEYRGQEYYYSQPGLRLENERVDVYTVFQNEEENHLGMPLPAGVYRIYQADSDGSLQFAGEDRKDHMPKDEEIRLMMGQAFDIVAERHITDYRVIAADVYESAVEVTLRNHKDVDVVVDVVEPMTSDWEIISGSHESVKKDARTAVFSLTVPADGEVTLTYEVRVRN